MQNPAKLCVWLTFDSRRLESIILRLSEQFAGPIFQPHCTIIGKTDVALVRLKSAVINTAEQLNIREVHIDKIGFSDEFWESYYLELAEDQVIIRLHNKLTEFLGIDQKSDYFPHISLMYNSINEIEKRKIKLPIEIGETINIRSLQITECGDRVENWKPVFEMKINS